MKNSGKTILSSFLFVPIVNEKHMRKAVEHQPDAVILDLEASIPDHQKAEAREMIPSACEYLKAQGQTVLIRINRGCEEDIAATVVEGVDGIIVPRAEDIYHISTVEKAIKEAGFDAMLLYPIIETPLGLINLRRLIEGSSHLSGIMYGSEDFVLEMGPLAEPCTDTLFNGVWQVSVTARAYGLPPYGLAGTLANFRELDEFRSQCEQAKRVGIAGVPAIHPDQLKVVKEVFRPSQEELDYAIKAIEDFEANGEKVITVEGKMVDYPIYYRFKDLLANYGN